ncbi:MAG: aminotransferase class IV [Alphaproteobacteria bacterium]
MKNILWNNGYYTDDTERVFYIYDRIRYGDAVFDTMLVQDKKPVHIKAHFDRLLRHGKVMNIHFDMSFDDYQSLVHQLIEKNDLQSFGKYSLNTWVSRGLQQPGIKPLSNPELQIVLKISEMKKIMRDIHAHIATNVRRNEGSPLSQIKSCNYGDNILAMIEANSQGRNEAVMLNNKGDVTCTTSGNIFCMEDGKMITPPLQDGVIDGIVRKMIIERYEAVEKSITREQLEQSDSIFMTNSLRGMSFFKTLNGRELKETSLKIDKNFHVGS